MGIPTARDIRDFLEGYCIDGEEKLSLIGNILLDSAVISNINTKKLKTGMRISGTGIPDSFIISIDLINVAGQITISDVATVTSTGVALAISYYNIISDEWIIKRRDNMVIPYIERVTGMSLREITQVTEYYSGTGKSILFLNRRPVISIENISYTNIPFESQTGNLLQSVELIKEEGMLKSKTNFNEGSYDPIFSRGTDNLKVTYTYGFTDLLDGNGLEALDLGEAIINMISSKILNFIGSRTGGGSLSGTNWSRQFGDRGKYNDILNELDKSAYSILRKYTTGVVGL